MGIPLHKKIQQDLLDKIKSGEYAENETIPTEMELADIYSVSRPTVRQAVQSLVNDGYLEKRKKRGTVVKKPKIQQEFTHVIESFDSEMNRKGILPKTKILKFTCVKANEEVAEKLNLKLGDAVYKLIRLRYAEEKPVVLVTSYIPCHLFPELQKIDFTSELLYTTFERLNHPIRSVSRKLEVIKADETTSDLLDVEEDDPVFYFHTLGFSDERLPVEYSISKYRGDINYFVFELSR
ncbi:GntR family transcriptional regulator [Enterococcus sp. BWB1-3]|uniref:GntR family transcriptional regulator n=1 Tax=unclassified Enterococcus TaxID=2608891 RepID=UPI0019234D43|nr:MULTISPECIES: GntR family transcriptional regulator [unclassified Enterococcus]MBL1229679.1 GntR family transcriptional regulator [Enterococcus sp. BWB1-3]MCB5953817.1 GntR family transcriptional regulator [Enterococcus sp. CWB-B31]